MRKEIKKKSLFIGLDLGTSAIKGIIMDNDGVVITETEKKTCFIYPYDGCIEVEPEGHYQAVCEVIRKLAASSVPGSVKAIAMAAASGNTLLSDKNGSPLTNIISWMDKRVVPEMFSEQKVREITGWPCVNIFPLAHLAWLRENRTDLYENADRYCMNTDWLLFRFTGNWLMDYSTATTFHLQEQISRTYYEPFLNRLEIPEEKLSALVPSGTNAGRLTVHAAKDTGLSASTELFTGCFDHPAAARAEGIFKEGQMLLSCGTSWVGFFPKKNRQKIIDAELLCDPFLSDNGGPWGAIFSVPYIGRNIDWYIDNLIAPCEKNKYDIFNALAAEAMPGANGLTIDLRDTPRYIDAERKNISRAIMESAARLLKEKLFQLEKSGMKFENAVMVGGPSKSSIWPSIIADITELKLTIGSSYSGAKGAALLAGIGLGLYHDENDAYQKTRGKHEG